MIPRGGLLGLPTPRPTTLGLGQDQRGKERSGECWGGKGEARGKGEVEVKEIKELKMRENKRIYIKGKQWWSKGANLCKLDHGYGRTPTMHAVKLNHP